VLVNIAGPDGASNRPPLTAPANSHTDTASTNGHRNPAADAAARTAAAASANTEPVASTGGGSGSRSRASTVNAARIRSACAAKRRNHPRTVEHAIPNPAAIRRCPKPAARPTSPAPITAALSARRSSPTSESSTWVRPQPAHIERRGRSHTSPAAVRSERARANPHGLNEPAHNGHANRPARSDASTPSASAPTVSKLPPSSTHGPPDRSAKR
jgi:hypothetical protein